MGCVTRRARLLCQQCPGTDPTGYRLSSFGPGNSAAQLPGLCRLPSIAAALSWHTAGRANETVTSALLLSHQSVKPHAFTKNIHYYV